MTETRQLLNQYAHEGSEPAFRELVARYVNLVYSTARRLVGGDSHLAEDVTQIVFTDLARMARGLAPEVMLGGWLHQRTFHVATTLIRAERRRQDRERRAAEMNLLEEPSGNPLARITPILDEAIIELNADDRKAILLRFFEQREFRLVGEALGINEDAARMRVHRALEKLHSLLQRRGVALSAATLGTVLAADAVTAAPAGLVLTVSSAALTTAAAGAGTTLTLFKLMTMTKLQAGLAGAIIVVAAAVPMAIHQHNQSESLAQANEVLRRQLDGSKTENEPLAAAAPITTPSSDSSSELLKLRAEVARLRADASNPGRNNGADTLASTNSMDEEFQELQARVALLKQKLDESPAEKIPEEDLLPPHDWLRVALTADLRNDAGIQYNLNQLRTAAKNQFAPMMATALRNYVDTNGGQLPASLAQLKSYLPPVISDAILDRYELLHTGSASELPSGTPIVAEKATTGRIIDSLYSIGLDRYSIKTINQTVNGRGMRVGGADAEVVNYLSGTRVRYGP